MEAFTERPNEARTRKSFVVVATTFTEAPAASSTCLVMMFTTAIIEFAPYPTEFDPRVTSMRSTSSMLMGKSVQLTRANPGRYMDIPSISTLSRRGMSTLVP